MQNEFLKDVANHRMYILRDDGIYRHLQFQTPGTSDQFFDLHTWPGGLCYTGDMGTFVFERLPDMFKFFRSAEECRTSEEPFNIPINPDYWSGKVVSMDLHGIKEYSEERFRELVLSCLDAEASPEFRKAVEEEVLIYADDGQHHALKAAMEFEFEGTKLFEDFWEYDLTDYTRTFLWCCYAIRWGIHQYDQEKLSATPEALAAATS
jgi:hypothetical protein